MPKKIEAAAKDGSLPLGDEAMLEKFPELRAPIAAEKAIKKARDLLVKKLQEAGVKNETTINSYLKQCEREPEERAPSRPKPEAAWKPTTPDGQPAGLVGPCDNPDVQNLGPALSAKAAKLFGPPTDLPSGTPVAPLGCGSGAAPKVRGQ